MNTTHERPALPPETTPDRAQRITNLRQQIDSLSTAQLEHARLSIGIELKDKPKAIRLKPTLFGAFIGGLLSGAALATVIGLYTLWANGVFA